MTEKETRIQNKIAEDEKKIEQYKKQLNQLEKRKQLELSREIKKEEKKKISDQIFIGKNAIRKNRKERNFDSRNE